MTLKDFVTCLKTIFNFNVNSISVKFGIEKCFLISLTLALLPTKCLQLALLCEIWAPTICYHLLV